ncbi:MAG TPA: YdeI/OmpD-associated family protein [Acidimicrobiia bacterium]
MPEFRAIVEEARGGGALVAVPREVVAALGSGGRIPVRATFDGVPYQGSVVSMGGTMVIGVLKDIRERTGKQIGDKIAVTLERDTRSREVEIPDDLREELKRGRLTEKFEHLSYTKRREAVARVTGAKKPETRQTRIAAIVRELGEKGSGGARVRPDP